MQAIITEHALLRWIERRHGIDIEAMRLELQELVEPYVAVRAAHAPLGGLYAVIRDTRVTTVTPTKPRGSALGKHDRENVNNTIEFARTAKDFAVPWQGRSRKRAHR